MPPPHSLCCALSDSVASGAFIDTKFYLFSLRNSSGKASQPRPLYTSSQILRSVQYFEDLLSGGFSEGVTKGLDYEPFERFDQAEDYDYLSDSDLEDEIEVAEPATSTCCPETKESRDPRAAWKPHNELNNTGKVVILRGVSYLTFQAIVMYLYTGEVGFAPFGSKANRELRATEMMSPREEYVPNPSPKSIYRAADMYDIPKLKELAFADIKEGLRSCDAIEETFSTFTSRYPEMIDLHAENLASVLLSSNSEEVQGQLDEKLRTFTRGDIPHAAKAISTLFGILARCCPSEVPPETDVPGRRAKSKCSWAEGGDHDIPPYQKSMNTALIRSMRHGTFLDMEYVARKKRVGDDKFVSIYLSSIIFRSVGPKLDALVSASNSAVGDGGQEVDDDSDYEGPAPEPMEVNTDVLQPESDVTRRNVLPGAFTTWKSLFLYLCFNEITFGPLRSQEVSLNFSPTRKGADVALYCSPKSLYHLAQLLGLALLADLAFDDITGKLTSENIVVELFSRSTSRDDRLTRKQSLLLTSSLKTPKTTTELQQYVQEAASGALPHCYDALRLTFGNAVGALKEGRRKAEDEQKAREEAKLNETRTTLKCAFSCNNPLTDGIKQNYPGGRCTTCGARPLCSGCGQKWRGEDVCRCCGKTFK